MIQPNIPSAHPLSNKIKRVLWGIVWYTLFWPTPKICFRWRNFLLRCFGAKIGRGVHVYPRVKIWLPENLELGNDSCLANDVDCYNVDKITVKANSTVTQYSYLCTTSHDITKRDMPLITAPIVIEDQVWVAAGAFIGMGVTIGQGAVVGARACVFKDVEPWTVVGGNPAKFIKKREINP